MLAIVDCLVDACTISSLNSDRRVYQTGCVECFTVDWVRFGVPSDNSTATASPDLDPVPSGTMASVRVGASGNDATNIISPKSERTWSSFIFTRPTCLSTKRGVITAVNVMKRSGELE